MDSYPLPTTERETQSPRLSRPLRLYPLDTRPLTDLKVVLLGLPLFWLFGLEQVAPPFLLIWATLKLFIPAPKIKAPPLVFIFSLFLIWQIVPQVALESGRDWVVSGRNLLAYGSAVCITLILANDVKSMKEVNSVIGCILFASFAATAIALSYVAQAAPGQFQALMAGAFLPGFLKSSQFVQENILAREIGRLALFGTVEYPRISSLFLYPTGASIGYVIFLCWQWRGWQTSRNIRKWLMGLLFAASGLVFLLTGARVAWLSFAAAIALLILFQYQLRARLPLLLAPILLSTGALALLVVGLSDDTLSNYINALFVDVRAGSFRSRLALYEETLALWAERPLIGWGVSKQVNVVTLAPVGTHSEILGVLFRSGLIGLALYTAANLTIWFGIGQAVWRAIKQKNSETLQIGLTIGAAFFAVNIMYAVYSFYFDFTVVLLLWTTIGLLYSSPIQRPAPAHYGN